MSTIAVKGRFPVNAHSTVPRDTPLTIVSRHRYTRRGAANALRSLVSVRDGYVASHGNAAAFLVWVEVDGQSIDPVDLEIEFGPF